MTIGHGSMSLPSVLAGRAPAGGAAPVTSAEAARLRDRNDRIVRTLVLAYVALVGGLAVVFGIRLTPDVVAVAAVLAVVLVAPRLRATGRWPALREWLPFLTLALAYELIRGFGPVVIARADVQEIPALERVLLGGRLATEMLQEWLRPLTGFDPLAAGATVLYVLHTPLPIAIGAYLWLLHRRLFYDFMAALVLLSIAAFATYLLYPAAPPWWAAAVGKLAGPGGDPLIAYLKPTAFDALFTSAGLNGKALFTLTFGEISPDPVAAFPSLHAAYPFLAYLFLRRVGGLVAWAMAAYTAAAWFSIVYLGDHYVVDVLGGIAYALVAAWLVPRMHGRRFAAAAAQPPGRST